MNNQDDMTLAALSPVVVSHINEVDRHAYCLLTLLPALVMSVSCDGNFL